MEFIMVVLAVAMGAGGMYLYLVDFVGYRKPEAPVTAPSIDIAREP